MLLSIVFFPLCSYNNQVNFLYEYNWHYVRKPVVNWVMRLIVHLHHCTKKATIHQVTTMLTTSKNVIFPGHNHLLTTGIDDPTL